VPFAGGALVALGYELGASLEPVAVAPADALALPDLTAFGVDRLYACDHVEGRVFALAWAEDADPTLAARAAEIAAGAEAVADAALRELGLPAFVKPASLGSSVGVSKAKTRAALVEGLRAAARYDDKVMVERAVDAREIEVGVLGDEAPEASVVGEIVPKREFYDYESKYVDEDTELLVPAPLDEATAERARTLALRAFRLLEGAGLARVDFFLDRRTGELFLNELNSLPGFTEVSMYPRLWRATGLSYAALLDRLIELALARHRRRAGLERTYRRG